MALAAPILPHTNVWFKSLFGDHYPLSFDMTLFSIIVFG
jgi:hypothetical protein